MKARRFKIWIEALEYLKNPKDQRHDDQRIAFKFKHLFSIFILDALLVITAGLLIVFAEEIGWVSTDTHAINEWYMTMSNWSILFWGVIFAPFFEEIIFRFYLRKKYNPIRLISFITEIVKPSSRDRVRKSIDRNWHRYYGIFFYINAILFGAVHIINYELSQNVLLFLPLLTAPQIVAGLFFGYMRVKFGLVWAMLLHALQNLLFIGISLLITATPISEFKIENEHYKLEVSASGFDNSNSFISSHLKDTITYDNVRFKYLMSDLLNTEEILIDIKPEDTRLENIDLEFISFKDSLDFENIVLKHLQKQHDFEVLNTNKPMDVYVITIADKEQLNKNLNKVSETSLSKVSRYDFKLENINVDQLAKTLNLNYDEFILSEAESQATFDFYLEKTDFEGLKRQLNDNYGLELIKASRKVEKITIQFEE